MIETKLSCETPPLRLEATVRPGITEGTFKLRVLVITLFHEVPTLNSKGAEGGGRLIPRWIEKDGVSFYNIIGCAVEIKLSLPPCTLLGASLDLVNGQKRTLEQPWYDQQQPFKKRQECRQSLQHWGQTKGTEGGSLPNANKSLSTHNVPAPKKGNGQLPKDGCFECGAPWNTLQELSKTEDKNGGKWNAQDGFMQLGNQKEVEMQPETLYGECRQNGLVKKISPVSYAMKTCSSSRVHVQGMPVILAQISNPKKRSDNKSERETKETLPIVHEFPKVVPEDLHSLEYEKQDSPKTAFRNSGMAIYEFQDMPFDGQTHLRSLKDFRRIAKHHVTETYQKESSSTREKGRERHPVDKAKLFSAANTKLYYT
ncbi:hypothetical protein Tco_1220668 [Tanacetum coccineum]